MLPPEMRCGALTLMLAIACGSPAIAPTRPAPPVSTLPREPPPPRLFAMPTEDPRLVRASGGTIDFVVGGIRARVVGDAMEVAQETFVSSIVATARDARWHWFVSEAGSVARARSFLGDLELVDAPNLGVPTSLALPWDGPRLWLYGVDGAVLTPDGDGWRAFETGMPIQRLAFESAARGAAVVLGGGVIVTEDGGATWEGRALPDDAVATGVVTRGEALVVRSASGAFRVQDEGLQAVQAIEPAASQRGPEPAPRLERYRFRVMPVPAYAVTDTGRTAVPTEHGLRVLDATSGQSLASPLATGRSIRRFGADTLMAESRTSWVEIWPRVDQPREELPFRHAESFALDGRTVAWLEEPDQLVLQDPDGRSERLALPDGGTVTGVTALDDGVIAVGLASTGTGIRGLRRRTRDHFTGRAFVRDPGDGTWRPLCPGQRPFDRIDRVNGHALVVARGRQLGIGDVHRCPELHELPEGATIAAFESGRRGVAIGATLGTLSHTADGGRTWRPVPVPSEEIVMDERRPLVCSALGCDLHSAVARFAVRWQSVGPVLRGPPPAAAEVSPSRVRSPRVDCTGQLVGPLNAAGVPGAAQPARQQTRPSAAGWSVQLEWTAGGAVRRSRSSSLVAETGLSRCELDRQPRLGVLAAHEGGALVRCAEARSRVCGCTESLYWFPTSGEARAVDLPVPTVTVARGRRIYAIAGSRVAVIEADGTWTSRSYGARQLSLAVGGGPGEAPGVVLGAPAAGAHLQPIDGPRHLGSPLGFYRVVPRRVCGPEDTGVTTRVPWGAVYLGGHRSGFPDDGALVFRGVSTPRRGWAEIRQRGDETCLSRVFAYDPRRGTSLELHATADQRLTGTYINRRFRRVARCRFR